MSGEPLVGVVLTLGAYALVMAAGRRWQWVNPALFTALLVMALLWLMQIDYSHYATGAAYITFLLGPATVALAVPLVKQIQTVRRQSMAVVGGVVSRDYHCRRGRLAVGGNAGGGGDPDAKVCHHGDLCRVGSRAWGGGWPYRCIYHSDRVVG